MLDIKQINGLIPHQYPFLLVDSILEIEEGPTPSCIRCNSDQRTDR